MKRWFTIGFAALALSASAVHANPAENRSVAERVLLERMGQGRFDLDTVIYGPGFVAHAFGRDLTLEQDRASGERTRAAFPDLVFRVERTTAEGDLVAVHWSGSGTNSVAVGPYPGNGRRVTLEGMSFFRFANGQIVEEWTTYDNLSLM